MPNNEPINVATEGGVSTHAITLATDGFIGIAPGSGVGVPNIPPNNVGSLISEPNRDWWVREDRTDVLFGPLSFKDANAVARAISNDEDRSGLSQICTYLGARGGDPIKNPDELFVVFMYIRGKRTLGGRTAEYHSDNDLPPTT